MAAVYSQTIKDNQLSQIEGTIGTAPKLRIYTGAPPANITDAASGTLLVEITLPTDWLSAPASNQVTALGTPWTASASAGGTAGYFRIYDSAGTTAHIQGTVTATGGGGDIELDNTSIASGQTVNINSFTISGP